MSEAETTPPERTTPVGRSTDYTTETGDIICELVADGFSVRRICEEPGMPTRLTVMNWLDEQPGFYTKFVRARLIQADYMDDMILETANNVTSDSAQADRVRIAAYQWRAARLAPKKFGDRLDINPDQDRPMHVSAKTDGQRAKAMAALLAKKRLQGQ